MSNESKCPGHNRAECVSCCWPKADLVWGENIGLSADDVRSLHGSNYTAVDMTTAAAQGFRDGAASVVVDLPGVMKTRPFQTIDRGSDNFKAGFNMAIRLSGAAILAAGGTVKE